MTKALTRLIEKRLDEGVEKIYLERELHEHHAKIEYNFILGNYPEKVYKKRFKTLNHVIMFFIVVLGLIKMYSFFMLTLNLDMILRIVGVILIALIPIYIMMHIIKFKRSGYLLLMLTTVVGLYLPLYKIEETVSNWSSIESVIVYSDVIMSSFLILSCIYLIRKIYGSFSY